MAPQGPIVRETRSSSILHLRNHATITQCIDLHSQLLSALTFIHAHGQTHRDLKPQNSMAPTLSILCLTLVLYSSMRGLWKIADFGTTGTAGTTRLQLTESGRGSSGYRAPELMAETSAFNQKSDIWCLGCIFYELCTGKTAFRSDFEVFEFRSPETLSFQQSSLCKMNLNAWHGRSGLAGYSKDIMN